MAIYVRLHTPLQIHKHKRKRFVAFQTPAAHWEAHYTMHSDHTHVGCAAGNGNSEFKKFIPEDEHSSHSLNSFNSLGYLFTSQYIRDTKQLRMSWLLLDLQGCAFVLGILTVLRHRKGA